MQVSECVITCNKYHVYSGVVNLWIVLMSFFEPLFAECINKPIDPSTYQEIQGQWYCNLSAQGLMY